MLQEPGIQCGISVGLLPAVVLGIGIDRELHFLDAQLFQIVDHAFGFLGRHHQIFAAVKRPDRQADQGGPVLLGRMINRDEIAAAANRRGLTQALGH